MLRELGAGLIVGDIPPLAFAVGAAAGIPSIGLGNFTWDWIYADYPRVRLAPSLLPAHPGAYSKASMALRLPMSRGFESFSNVKDIPFIARHARRTRDEVCKILKLPTDKPIVLLVQRLRPARPRHRTRWRSSRSTRSSPPPTCPEPRRKETPAAERKGSLDQRERRSDVRRRRPLRGPRRRGEVVVTKPGYGIIAESSPTTPRCSTPRAATSPSTTCSWRRCRSTCARRSSATTISSPGSGNRTWTSCARSRSRRTKPETNGADVAAESAEGARQATEETARPAEGEVLKEI